MIHGHRRFVSGVYFKIHPICCNSLHCNHRFFANCSWIYNIRMSAQVSRNRVAPGHGATPHAGALPRGGDNNNGFANSSSPLLQRCALSSSCSSVVVCDGVNHLPMLPH